MSIRRFESKRAFSNYIEQALEYYNSQFAEKNEQLDIQRLKNYFIIKLWIN